MEIKNFNRVHGDVNIIAEFSVYMEAWKCTICNFKIKPNKKGGWFVAYPQTAKEINGKWEYTRTVQPDGDLAKQWEQAVYFKVKDVMRLEGL